MRSCRAPANDYPHDLDTNPATHRSDDEADGVAADPQSGDSLDILGYLEPCLSGE